MSEMTVVEPETSDEPAEQSDVSPWKLDGFGDESRIADPDRFLSALDRLRDAAQSAVAVAVTYTNATRLLAEARVSVRAQIMRPNGFPDWSADSDPYRTIVSYEEGKVYTAASLAEDAKRRLGDAVKQQVRRNYLLPGVVAYILTNEVNFGDELDKWNSEGGRERVLSDPSERLKDRVRAHYAANPDKNGKILTIPDTFKNFEESHVKTTKTTPVELNQPENVFETASETLAGITQVVPKYSAPLLLKAISELSVSLLAAKGAIEGRATVIEDLRRISEITEIVAGALDGNLSGAEFDSAMETLSGLYFNSTDVPA